MPPPGAIPSRGYVGRKDVDGEAKLFVLHVIELQAERRNKAKEQLSRYWQLLHPALPRLVEFCEHEDGLVAVFEPVDGVTLARLKGYLERDREQLPDAAIWYLGHQVMGALARAHLARDARGQMSPIVHGTLSARDVLVSWGGEVRLMGVCPVLTELEYNVEDEESDELQPARAWLAPELRRGWPASPRSDVYAAALLLRSLLTCQPPPTPGAVIEPLATLRPDVPAEVAAALDVALEANAKQRTTSCAEIEQRLAGLVKATEGQRALRETMELFEALWGLYSVATPDKWPEDAPSLASDQLAAFVPAPPSAPAEDSTAPGDSVAPAEDSMAPAEDSVAPAEDSVAPAEDSGSSPLPSSTSAPTEKRPELSTPKDVDAFEATMLRPTPVVPTAPPRPAPKRAAPPRPAGLPRIPPRRPEAPAAAPGPKSEPPLANTAISEPAPSELQHAVSRPRREGDFESTVIMEVPTTPDEALAEPASKDAVQEQDDDDDDALGGGTMVMQSPLSDAPPPSDGDPAPTGGDQGRGLAATAVSPSPKEASGHSEPVIEIGIEDAPSVEELVAETLNRQSEPHPQPQHSQLQTPEPQHPEPQHPEPQHQGQSAPLPDGPMRTPSQPHSPDPAQGPTPVAAPELAGAAAAQHVPSPQPPKRRGWLGYGLGLLLVVAVGAAGIWWWLERERTGSVRTGPTSEASTAPATSTPAADSAPAPVAGSSGRSSSPRRCIVVSGSSGRVKIPAGGAMPTRRRRGTDGGKPGSGPCDDAVTATSSSGPSHGTS